MKIIKREMIVKEQNENKGFPRLDCQASFNSDGVITIRNYNAMNKNDDEIIILSKSETKAILQLFSQIGSIEKSYNLPF